MNIIHSSRRHYYVARFSIFLIALALVVGTVSCVGDGNGEVKYSLTMAENPAAGGTATDLTGASPYAANTVVNITAAANLCYRFVSWSAPASTFGNATAAQTTFTMPAQNIIVTANFEEIPEGCPTLLASISNYTAEGWCSVGGDWIKIAFTTGNETQGPTIGEQLVFHTGDTGSYDFTADVDPDFDAVCEYLTNGINDDIWLKEWWGGCSGAGGGKEADLFGEHPDLCGCEISFIRLVVHSISVSEESFDYNCDWEVWGYGSPV
jgi:hypothetical protein